MSELQQHLKRVEPLADALVDALRLQIRRLELGNGDVTVSDPRSAVYSLERDPATGADSLVGQWRDRNGLRVGMLAFHADGSFFAEHDVIRAHPRDPQLFVEAVHAWGRGSQIKAEPRLMPMVP